MYKPLRSSLEAQCKESACNEGEAGDRIDPCFGRIPLEEGMVTYFSILAWRIPWTAKSGGLQFREWQRVIHD